MSSYKDRHRQRSPVRNDPRTSGTSVDDSGRRDQPRTLPSEGLVPQGGSIFPRDEPQQLREPSRERNYGIEGGGTRADRVVDHSKDFAKLPLNDTARCARFINEHPEILREQDIESRYLDPATRLLAIDSAKSKEEAFRYLERFVIIVCVKEYHKTNRGQFLNLVRTDGEAKDYMKLEFRSAKDHCDKRVRLHRLRSSEMPYFARERDVPVEGLSRLNINQNQPRQPDTYTSRSGSDRHAGATEGTQRVDAWQEQDPRHRHSTSVELPLARRSTNTTNRHDPREPDIPEEGLAGAQPTGRPARAGSGAGMTDNRFQPLPQSEWNSYFKIGRVFAIKSYTQDNSAPNSKQDDYSVEKLRLNKGDADLVIMKIRRMVIVGIRHGFCLTVPINTYGSQGLKKPGLGDTNINAHARIHMDDTEPRWLPDEPRPGKRDIAVRKVKDSRHVLHPASRICFERAHSVDYNERILKIGTVTEGCLGYLRQYWQEQIERNPTQSQTTKQPSGQGQRHR